MYNNSQLKLILVLFFVILMLFVAPIEVVAQMPPHQSLLEKMEANKTLMQKSYYFQNKSTFESRGIDAPWRSALLQSNKSSTDKAFNREYGPAQAPTGNWNALVILVKFPDKTSQVSATYFDNLLFGSSFGSVKDFYSKVSYGALTMTTANLPSTITWVQAPQPYTYYCNNQNGTGAYPNNSQKLVEDVVALVNPSIDFSKYDNDHDGYVDALFIVHTGPGAEYTGNNADIWSHAWQVPSDINVDGVKVSRYSTEPEYWSTPGDMTIGVFAHELGHAAFGLPDLYDRDYSSRGLGKWTLMAGGSWNGSAGLGDYPAFPDVWSHAQMGYINPTVITTNSASQSIPQIETNANGYILWKNGSFTNEYFILENRQQVEYDTYLPGKGLLVYHIDKTITTQNDREWYPGFTTSSHYLVALEQADGLWNLEKNDNSGDAADPFPGSGNKSLFAYLTTPNTNDYKDQFTGVAIKNINQGAAAIVADLEVNSSQKLLAVTYPNGGERLRVNNNYDITWISNSVSQLKIEFTSDNGVTWNTISNNATASNQKYTWTVPNTVSNLYKIKLTAVEDNSVADMSDAVFGVSQYGIISEVEPNNTIAQAFNVNLKDTVDAAINAVGDIDYYKIQGTAGDTLEVYLKNLNSSQLETRLALLDASGNYIVESYDYNNTLYENRVVYVIPSNGTYYIRTSYQGNYSGVSTDFVGKEKKQQSEALLTEKDAEKALYDEGAYRITFNKFKTAKPIFASWDYYNTFYNSTFSETYCYPNGLVTSAKLEYGPTTSYGNNVTVNNINTFNSIWVSFGKIQGLTANTVYHFRITLTNSKGNAVSGDLTFKTPPAPDGWTIQNNTLQNSLQGVDFVDNINGAIAGYWRAILGTTDGGTTWANKYFNTPNIYIYGVDQVTVSKIVAVGSSGYVHISTDKGSTWTSTQVAGTTTLLCVSFADVNNGVIGNSAGEFYKTTNGGSSWQKLSLANTETVRDIKMLSASRIIAAVGYGKILISNDGGSTWSSLIVGNGNWFSRGLSFVDANNGVLATSRECFKTTDSGQTWTKLTDNSLIYQFDTFMLNTSTIIAVGESGGIIVSADGGSTWATKNSGTFNYLLSIGGVGASVYTVGDYGTILSSAKYLQVISPNGGEKWGVGTTNTIKWLCGSVSNINIEYSVNSGNSWTSIVTNVNAALSKYDWTIPNQLSANCLIRISDAANSSFNDVSDNVFSIVNFPKVVVTPENLEFKSIPGDSVTTQLNIKNDGLANLNWAINKPVVQTSPQIELQLEQIKQSLTERAVLSFEGETLLNGYRKIEYQKEDIVRTFRSPNLNSSGIKVALLSCGGSTSYDTDIANKLLATTKIGIVTVINCNAVTPTLNELKLFDAVLVYSNAPFLNATEFGNNLADYADAGGGVVLSMFSMYTDSQYTPGGKFANTKYLCVPNSVPLYGPTQTLGQIFNQSDPILEGVTSFNGGSQSFRQSNFNVLSGATRVANWSDGAPLVVTKINNEVSRADVLFFPPSSDVSSDCWLANTDGAKLLANALIAVSKTASWLTYTPESGALNPSANTNVSIKANAKNLSFGSYSTKVSINTDDPSKPSVNVPIKLDLKGVRIASPNGGETFKVGTIKQIKWQSSLVTKIKIEFSANNGNSWLQIATDIDATLGIYQFTIPNSVSSNCLVKITDTTDPLYSDQSDAVFSIILSGPISEIEPNNTREAANEIAYADTVDASINTVGDIDYYKFNGTTGDTVMVYGEKRGTTNSLEGRIRLLDQNGNYLYESTSFTGTSQKQRIGFVLQATGTYYIRYSYRNNTSGMPPAEVAKYEQEMKQKELRGEKEPELGTYDQGDYRLVLTKFKVAAPLASGNGWSDFNYNSVRIYGQFVPNGLPTTATIEYGTSASYGSSIVLASAINSLNELGNYTDKITGLNASTMYHFRMKVENAKGVVYSGDYVFTTPASPEGWAFANSGTSNSLRAIKYYDANIGYTVGNGGIWKTTDGGLSWINKKSGNDYNAIEIVDANTAIAVGYNQKVSKTTDGGSTWTDVNIGCYGNMDISFKDANNGVIVTYCGEMFKTTDGGNTWNALTISPSHSDLYTVKYFSNNTIIATGYDNYVVRSTDGGSTWTSQQLNGNSYLLRSMSFKDNNNGILVGSNGMAFKTTNAGVTWTALNTGHGYNQYGVNYQSNGTVVSVGSSGSIYKSADDGDTWTRQQSGSTNYLNGIITIGNSSTLMIVGDWGTMMKSTNYLKVVMPNGGENWKVGSQKNIVWAGTGVNKIKIEYTTNNGGSWTQIITDVVASKSPYVWTVPNTLSNQCKVRITNTENTSMVDESDASFNIIPVGPITETEPNNTIDQAMQIAFADTVNASINTVGDVDYYKIFGVQGDTLAVNSYLRNSSQIDGKLSLIDQYGNYQIDSWNFGSDNYKQRVVFVLPYTGVYYARYSYKQNWNGVPVSEQEKYNRDKQSKHQELTEGPQLGTYDQGDYAIAFTYFKKSSPLIAGFSITDINYNSVRFNPGVYPNGLDTKITVDYGVTISFGNSIVVTSSANGLNEMWWTSSKVTGLQPNTTYFARVTAENLKGSITSATISFTTPQAPTGWAFQNSPTSNTLNKIDFADANNGAIAADWNTILVSKDGGSTWENKWVSSVGDFYSCGIEQLDATTIVTVGSSGIVLRSTDSGNTWVKKTLPTTSYISDIHFLNITAGVVCNVAGQIYKTNDGGINWTNLNTGNSDGLLSVQMIDANTIVAVGWNRRILVTTNGGTSWTSSQMPNACDYLWSVSFIDKNIGLVAEDCGRIYKTTDGGLNWIEKTNPTGMWLQGIKFVNSTIAYIVGGNGVLLKSVDAGNTWTQMQTGTQNALRGIGIASTNLIYTVGDWGTILKSQDYLKVVSPNGGERWKKNTQRDIVWSTSSANKVKIELSTNNGTAWSNIATDIDAGFGKYTWTTPNSEYSQCLVKVTDQTNTSLTDQSDAVFSTVANGPISEAEPNNTLATAMNLSYADTVDASINPIGDLDYYKIQGTQGDTLQVYSEVRNGSQLYGRLRLLDGNGNNLYDISSFANSAYKQRAVYILPTTGSYYVRYAYRDNYNGMPQTEVEKIREEKLNAIQNDKDGPQLGTNDQGDYRLVISKFKTAAPLVSYTYTQDLNYNSTRFYGQFVPNGLPTTATVEYGTTNSYGSSLVVASGVNSLGETSYGGTKVTVTPNTLYHYRLKVENSKGIAYSGDYTFTTPASPDGWSIVNSGITNTLYSIKYYDANIGFAVGSGAILKTIDGGISWTNVYSNYTQRSVDILSANKIVTVGSNLVFVSSDGGSTWSTTTVGSYSIYGVSFGDANNGVLCNSYGEVYKTADGGTTWNKLTLGVSVSNLYTIKYLSNNIIIAAGYNNYVIRSTDGGTTWTSQQLSGNGYAFYGMSFKDNNTGIIVGYSGMVFKTTDAGATWASLNSGHTYVQYGVNYQSNGTVLSVGGQGIIFKSGDDGATWTRQQSGTTNYLYGISTVGNTSSLMAVGNYGTILRSGTYLKVVSPNGGERWKKNTQRDIVWSTSSTNKVKIELSTNNGTAWSNIATDIDAGLGKYAWIVPNSEYSQCLVKVTDQTNTSLTDQSDAVFSTVANGPISESEPNNTRDLANAIAYADTIDAAISPIGDLDYYKFNGVAGDTVVVYGEKRGTANNLEGMIRLQDQNGNTITSNNYFQGSMQKQRVVYTIPSTGIYFIRYSWSQNTSGIPQAENEQKKIENVSFEESKEKGPQLGTYDEGEYRLILNKFVRSAPLVSYAYATDLNYNSTRFYVRFVPNGFPTTATIEFGTSPSYGTNLVLVTGANSLYEWGYQSEKISGLIANTVYHFRLKLENALGIVYSGDYTFTTPLAPDGWVFQNSGTTNWSQAIDFYDANNGVAVYSGTGNTFLITKDGGATWTNKYPSSPGQFFAYGVEMIDPNKIIVVGSYGIIYLTTDGGTTWASKTLQNTQAWILSVSFADANTGMCINDSGEIYKTTDGGNIWTKLSNGVTTYLKRIKMLDANKAIVIGGNRIVLKTTDGGTTWSSSQLTGTGNTFYGLSFKDANNGLIVGDQGMIFKTSDGGTSWNPISSGHNSYQQDVTYLANGSAYAVGENGKIYKSLNDGATWTLMQSGTTNWLYGVTSTSASQVYVVGDWGTILKSDTGPKYTYSIDLVVQDKNNTGNATLSFGTAATATDGLDTGLGESLLPPAPPTGIFDARLFFPNGTGTSLKDYRKDGQENITWTMNFQPGSSGYPMTFTWDKTKFPAEGSFILTDDVGGVVVNNVDMKAINSYTLTNPAIKTLLIKYSKTLNVNVILTKDWNILSVPVKAANMTTTVLFPDYASQTYSYDNGYKIVTLLENGKGYWLKYTKADTISVQGDKVGLTTIPVKAGWNLIGPYDWEVLVSAITTTPANIIGSQFYEYNNSYKVPIKLVPGKGYWIKVNADGVINLPPATTPSTDIIAAKMVGGGALNLDEQKEGLNISVVDAGGRAGALMLLKETGTMSMYDLPPMPPKGIYEVRWGSDRKVEKAGGGIRELIISSAEYPVKLTVTGGDVRIKDNLGGQMINQILRKGETLSISKKSIDRLTVEELEIPTEFRLCQNYPNPFNPETRIEYWLPENGKVTLKIYDVLGREVETLVDEMKEAGKYEVNWKAGNYSSGVYFYNIITGSNHSVKKMLLLK